MTADLRLVGMGEVQAVRGEADFSCVGIGSGIMIAAYDPKKNVGACGHFLLPSAPPEHNVNRPGKYVDTGIAQVMGEMAALGARPKDVRVAMIGGARLFVRGEEHLPCNLGVRNVEAAHRALAEFGVSCQAQEIGGQEGRTVTFSGRDGTVKIRIWPDADRVLCNLRG